MQNCNALLSKVTLPNTSYATVHVLKSSFYLEFTSTNMQKRLDASDAVWHHASKFADAINESSFVINMKFITFCQHSVKII